MSLAVTWQLLVLFHVPDFCAAFLCTARCAACAALWDSLPCLLSVAFPVLCCCVLWYQLPCAHGLCDTVGAVLAAVLCGPRGRAPSPGPRPRIGRASTGRSHQWAPPTVGGDTNGHQRALATPVGTAMPRDAAAQAPAAGGTRRPRLPRGCLRPAEPLQPPGPSACPRRRPPARGSGGGVRGAVPGGVTASWPARVPQADAGLCPGLSCRRGWAGGGVSGRDPEPWSWALPSAARTAQLGVGTASATGPGAVCMPGARLRGGLGRGGSRSLLGAVGGTLLTLPGTSVGSGGGLGHVGTAPVSRQDGRRGL